MITDKDDFFIDSFQLISGAPIAVPGLDLLIYQPKLFQIAQIGEERFYESLAYLKIDKKVVLSSIKDEALSLMVTDKNDYEILKMVMETESQIEKGLSEIFSMVIPDLESLKFNPVFMHIKLKSGQQYVINNEYFLVIKEILYKIFNLEQTEEKFRPINEAAASIAKKLEDRKKKLASLQGKKGQSVFSDFVSILAVGLGYPDISKILNLTVYQIFNLTKRFGMYNQYNLQVQAMLQGAEDVELIDWLQKI